MISFLIYISLFLIYFLVNSGGFVFSGTHYQLLSYYLLSLLFGAFVSRKYEFNKAYSSEHTLIKLYLSLVISLAFMALMLNFSQIEQMHRDYLLLVFFCGLILESYYFMLIGIERKNKITFVEHKNISLKYLTLDGIILLFFSSIWLLKPLNEFGVGGKEVILISALLASWLISAATTHKFIPTVTSINRWNAIELQVKFYLRIILLVFTSLIFLNTDYELSVYFVKSVISYSIISSLASMFLFADKIKNKSDEPTVVFLKAYEMNESDGTNKNGKSRNKNDKYAFTNTDGYQSVGNKMFQFEYLKEYGEVFSVLNTMLDLSTFDTRKSLLIDSDKPCNFISKEKNTHQLYVNLHVLNDQAKVNDYLLNVRDSLVEGGVFVGALLPHHYRYKRFLRQYSFWTANTLYFFDFIWKRVFPKLPVTREIYNAFSKDKDRAISLAEGLGRVVYCGFKIIDLAAVDGVVYFAAVKNGTFQPVKKFFYSPIFKMKRVGKNGKPIFVYKLRTMYPYSEFIQEFVYKHNNLEKGGKFKDDFRVPAWGKMFRKLWIDELPMLINWLKGDLKLVGVRPISNHYLSLYSKDHQERRMKFKPGLLPPFYADLPNTLEEIESSEKKYLDAYEKNPLKTDMDYCFKALQNILLKKKRSA